MHRRCTHPSPSSTDPLPPASASPADSVDIAEQLLSDGTSTHPFLGFRLAPLTDQLRDALGVSAQAGALVAVVDPGGPAATAGVTPVT